MTQTILVTGGAGYIGSHTCKALANAGYLPVTVDNMSGGHDWAVRWGPLEVGDVRDGAFLDTVFRKWAPRAVVHFAGLIQVGESVRRPDIYYQHNVLGSLTLLDRMRAHDVGRVVFSSTCAIFGMPPRVPLDEALPFAPINPYGASKAMVEQILRDYAHAYGLRAVALRYFNAAGADPGGEVGEAHDPESHLIPLAIQAVSTPSKALTVFGDDYPTPDGTCVRDYIHVADLADAHVRALAYLESAEGFEAFNLGNGEGYSVRQVIESVATVAERPVPHSVARRRAGDAAILVADARKAAQVLGWVPAIPRLDDIVRSAWTWHTADARRL
ncbi:UDP-glucose 4-epimerase GalE [Magnetospirillum fulvum]|uniref:UDP-glucose 4-epimerase n=1 Tax=Magnetospirillum fulvum MGU-K5 TaxID=1316936 RepID=S9TVP0_MAGFU|nr:UDP-glucose 4-epimerase GalE [Magnetospirillum fulvum]EPY02505.1 UDP-glucose 4-epimerase [Magnetospirillum fulvum MGU-K5]